ncbi:MAG: hypothetical protein R3E36_07485 [Nitrosomonas sp.]|nr:hypothetical protein [Nitrosomonas sp.]
MDSDFLRFVLGFAAFSQPPGWAQWTVRLAEWRVGWTATAMQDNYDPWQAKQRVNLDEVEKLELLDL